MPWAEVMEELEDKVRGTLQHRYRPLDNVPFFRLQYPPAQEREALRELRLLADRLRNGGWPVRVLSLTEVIRQGLSRLLNVGEEQLPDCLLQLERERERPELESLLAEYLPGEVVSVVVERLRDMPRESVSILTRVGALYPFVRSSSLESRLEGRVKGVIVLAYPGTRLGALLDGRGVDPRAGYYRGETIQWR